MKIQTKYTNLDHSPFLQQYIEKKIGSLEKLLKKFDAEGAVVARVEVGRTTQHHQRGPIYRAEINLQLPGKLIRAEDEDWQVRAAIDKMRGRLQREIVKYKETATI